MQRALLRDFGIEIEIAVAAERVWQVLAQVEHWPEWTQSVVRAEPLSAPPLGPGSRVRIYQRAQLAEEIDFVFTDGAPGRMTREEMLMHVITHGVGHRGQVSAVMLLNSVTPAPDGFTTYLHEAEALTRRRAAARTRSEPATHASWRRRARPPRWCGSPATIRPG